MSYEDERRSVTRIAAQDPRKDLKDLLTKIVGKDKEFYNNALDRCNLTVNEFKDLMASLPVKSHPTVRILRMFRNDTITISMDAYGELTVHLVDGTLDMIIKSMIPITYNLANFKTVARGIAMHYIRHNSNFSQTPICTKVTTDTYLVDINRCGTYIYGSIEELSDTDIQIGETLHIKVLGRMAEAIDKVINNFHRMRITYANLLASADDIDCNIFKLPFGVVIEFNPCFEYSITKENNLDSHLAIVTVNGEKITCYDEIDIIFAIDKFEQ